MTFSRRKVLTLAAAAVGGVAADASDAIDANASQISTSTKQPMPVVRISKGRYPPERHAAVTARLDASAKTLVPAIRQLPGCISYYVGSDVVSSTMVNVSVWDTLDHANAMSTLAPMVALAQEFMALGVEFERPIVNYPVLWQLP